jgi:glycolate oxidase iron-sulfur subunit
MLACIRCGLCLTSCPTYVLSLHESEGPRGRVGMARALAEGHLTVSPDLVEHELNCLVCDACSAVCPAGVHMDPLQVGLRAALEPSVRRSVMERLVRALVFGWLFSSMRRFRLFARLIWL